MPPIFRWTRLAACGFAAVGAAVALSAQSSGDAATLASVVDEYLSHTAAASGGGLARGLSPDRMQALSLDAARSQAEWSDATLKKLADVRPSELTHDQWLTLSDLRFDLTLGASAAKYFWFVIPITPYSSPLRALSAPFASFRFRSADDTATYLDALNQVPIAIAAYEAKLQSQVQRGIVLPSDEIKLVVPFVRTLVAEPPRSEFSVAASRLAELPADARPGFQSQVDDEIRSAINPSIQRLVAYIDGPYRSHAATAVGVGQYSGGAEYYKFLIFQHTDLDLTPEQIQQIGFAEVARLESELDKVRVAARFGGTFAEFRTFLKTDRRFFPKNADDIGNTMMAAIHRIEPKIDAFFLTEPKAPYGVKRLDESLEQSMTYGYYQIPTPADPEGLYRFNGSQPESRSLLMAPATIYHELIPGHHFQLALRQESTTLSPFRRGLMHTAFTEGWAEYASDLAGEMGMYDGDPYARAGRLAMDLFLSSRLVVDTGMNALGWPRERAMAYMRDHTLESDVQIDTETLRYSSDMPGQALAYKLGSREIHQLRDKVRQAQGDAFDIRKFHAYLLSFGSMPLATLDEHVACYLSEKHKQ